MTSTPTRPVDNVIIAMKGLQDRNINILAGTTVENKGKLIRIIITVLCLKNKKNSKTKNVIVHIPPGVYEVVDLEVVMRSEILTELNQISIKRFDVKANPRTSKVVIFSSIQIYFACLKLFRYCFRI